LAWAKALMDRDPNRTALREARRIQRLGNTPSVCAFCSYEGPVILVTLKWIKAHGTAKKFLEDHHPRGRNHDPDLKIPLCRNCHGECTEGLRRAGVSMRSKRNESERIALTLEAQAAFFEDFAKAQRRIADRARRIRG
jgi:hypothetical protein